MSEYANSPHPTGDALIEELSKLILARLTETITAEQLARLEDLVIHNPDARRIYARYVHQTALLHQRAALGDTNNGSQSRDLEALKESLLAQRIGAVGEDGQSILESLVPSAERISLSNRDSSSMDEGESVHPRRTVSPRHWGLAAAITISVIGVLVWFLIPGSPPPPPAPVAALTESHHASWEDKDGRLIFIRDGIQLPPQKLFLADGLAKLKFNDGAVVILDARQRRVQLDIVSARDAFLHVGKVTVRAESEEAQGFAVDLPGGLRVVDTGTEFGINVDTEGLSEVHVFDGSVQAQRRNHNGDIEVLRDFRVNETFRTVTTESHVELIDAPEDSDQFLRVESLKSLARGSGEQENEKKESAAKQRSEIKSDADLLIYYSFDRATESNGQLTNRATRRENEITGVLRGTESLPSWGKGRFGDNDGLHFESEKNQGIVVQDFGKAAVSDQLTIMLWVRVDARRHWNLLASQWGTPTGYFFHLATENDLLTLHLSKDGQHDDMTRIVGSSLTPADGWTHVAITLNTKGPCRLYRDGRLQGSLTVPFANGEFPITARQPLRFASKTDVDPGGQVTLHGAIDEIVVFRRELSSTEVREYFQNSRP